MRTITDPFAQSQDEQKHLLICEEIFFTKEIRCYCSCGKFESIAKVPCTLTGGRDLSAFFLRMFNDHLTSLTDPDAPTDAVIISETPRPLNFSKINEIEFLGSTGTENDTFATGVLTPEKIKEIMDHFRQRYPGTF